jgi:hypothetical protein
MRINALLFAFVLAGCTGNRLNADTKPNCRRSMRPHGRCVRRYGDAGHDDLSHR